MERVKSIVDFLSTAASFLSAASPQRVSTFGVAGSTVRGAVTESSGVFLCHSSVDKEQVRELYCRLMADGVRCWFDEEDLRPGQDWDSEIQKAIRKSRYVIACLSRGSIAKRGYVQKELRRAFDVAHEQPDGSIFLIPVRLEDCDVPERLDRLHRVDLFSAEGYAKLLKEIKPRPPD